ncbi:hypothetical protein JAO29_10525 [Edaphobacter sp. HDX4]|uniref:hypothetical protein n=1 Tax=Edaphobacter sp. HDX4 TaxID=2794064 RepID=UPI002FE55127
MAVPLSTYLNDHLGGARIAVELLEAMRDGHDDPKFREFATSLLPEVQQDDRTLRTIAERIGPGPSAIKEAGGWLVEKAARLKLGPSGSTDFAMFETLELLTLGIHGKSCLWEALQVVSRVDSRLQEFDFEELIRRAQQQYEEVDRRRLELARTVLSSGTEAA